MTTTDDALRHTEWFKTDEKGKPMSDLKYWAISGIGYGKGATVAEAVATHDEIQQRNYGKMLAVPVAEVPLIVWEPPVGITGFYLAGEVWWTSEDADFVASPTEARAARGQREHWWDYMRNEAEVEVERL